MHKKKQTSTEVDNTRSTELWATEVLAIVENPKQRGIEIRFNAEPSPQLQPKLRAMGFRHSRTASMWYGEDNQAARDFAERVKISLPNSPQGPELDLSPSAQAVKTNIESKTFSFVHITLSDGQLKNYIVFEPSKPKAEVIATNFAQHEFGSAFLSLAILPKTHVKEARVLFDEGKIIGSTQKIPIHKESVIKSALPEQGPSEENRDNLIAQKNQEDVSAHSDAQEEPHGETSEIFKTVYEQLRALIPDLAEHLEKGPKSGELKISGDNIERKLSYRLIRARETGVYDIWLRDSIDQFEKLFAEITIEPAATRAYVRAQRLSLDYAGKYERKDNLQPTNEEHGDIGQELTTALSGWLSDILELNYHILLERISQSPQPNRDRKRTWKEWVPGEEAIFSPLAMCQLILNNNYLQSMWRLKKDKEALTGNYFSNDHFDHLKAFWGVYVMQDAAIEEKYIEIYQALPDRVYYIENTRVSPVRQATLPDADLPAGLHSHPNPETTLPVMGHKENEPGLTSSKEVNQQADAGVKDLVSRGTPVPNIIVPLGVREPMLSHNFYQKSFDISIFPDLIPITDSVLNQTPPSQVYELLQLSHPTDYGIKVTRHALIELFEQKGEQIFIKLGLPTERSYPYVNLHTGYNSVESLNQLLGDQHNEWWAVADNYRAVGDPQKALTLLDAEIAKSRHEKKDLINTKTGKIKGKDKQTGNHLSWEVTQFQEGKDVIIEYLNTKPSGNKKIVTQEILTSVQGAYWTQADEAYPINKIFISGHAFNQSRLRDALEDLLGKLPLEIQFGFVDNLKSQFDERRSLEQRDKSLITSGKTGDQRKIAIIRSYVDDMIIDTDLSKPNGDRTPGVMQFLFDALVNPDDSLVDLPKDTPEIKKPEPSKKKLNQHELNSSIEKLIDAKDSANTPYSFKDKLLIQQYTGSGGLIKQGATGRGVLYEYYTPDEVVRKMWGLAYSFGYVDGPILEPAVGIGNFLKYAPKKAPIIGFDTSKYACRICQILYPEAKIYNKAFETIFFAGNIHLKDDFVHPAYSLVIGNPPYGEFTGRYAGMGEKKWTGAQEYDQYFIMRGLDLLKKGGLLILLVPSSFLSSGVKSNSAQDKIALKSDLLDAYRLPNKTFDTTDIGTDIVIFQKK